MKPTDASELLHRLRHENAQLRARRDGGGAATSAAPASSSAVREKISQVQSCLAEGNMQEALGALNATTAHRFTAIYRFDGEMLENLYVFDCLGEAKIFPTTPITESYCMYVREPEQFFATEDALLDPRTPEHPKREKVRSYCGIALLDEDGEIFGSLCHFDYAAFPLEVSALDLLDEVGRVLRRELVQALR